jgi:putative acetyltransferase
MVRDVVIDIDDPRRDDIRALLATHLTFSRGETAIEFSHALDVEDLAADGVTLYSARRAGELLGIGGIKQLEPDHGEIKSMHTSAAARGQGIGRAILEHLLAIARERAYHRVSLETGTTANFAAARALYHRAGFEPCQPFGGYPPSSENYFMTLELGG